MQTICSLTLKATLLIVLAPLVAASSPDDGSQDFDDEPGLFLAPPPPVVPAAPKVNRGSTPGAHDVRHYAVIAFVPGTNQFVVVKGYGRYADLEGRAIAKCPGANVIEIAWASNGYYTAIAVSGDGRAWGMGSGPTALAAQKQALAECRKVGSNCRILVCAGASLPSSNSSGSWNYRPCERCGGPGAFPYALCPGCKH
jgi:hypothetical protein